MRKHAIIQAAVILLFTGICLMFPPSGRSAVFLVIIGMALVSAVGFVIIYFTERRLGGKIASLSRELTVAVSRVASASQEIKISIDESNARSEELLAGSGAMNALITDVISGLGAMISRIKGMIGFSEEAREMSLEMERTGRASFDSANGAASEILGIVDTMNGIKISSGRTEESISKLKAASLDARAIIDKISEISQQMHIIAINASVEAVRAGRHGGSFSVVAREFQRLSSMTDEALGDIGGLLEIIQTDIDRVYLDARENSDRVDAGVRQTRGVEASLRAISSSFSEILSVADSLSGISGAQWRLSDEMSAGVGELETLVSQAGDNVRHVDELVRSQKQSVENIAAMGNRLTDASRELSAVTEGSAEQVTKALDTKTQAACADFFPIMANALARNPALVGSIPAEHERLLRAFKAAHPIVEAIWTNLPNGRFLCSLPPSGIANAVTRDWFKAALRGENYISSIYISGITKKECVTLSMPYYGEDGEPLGVLGVDMTLEMLKA